MENDNLDTECVKKRKYTTRGKKWLDLPKVDRNCRSSRAADDADGVDRPLFNLGKIGDERRKIKPMENRTAAEQKRINDYKKYGKIKKIKIYAVVGDFIEREDTVVDPVLDLPVADPSDEKKIKLEPSA